MKFSALLLLSILIPFNTANASNEKMVANGVGFATPAANLFCKTNPSMCTPTGASKIKLTDANWKRLNQINLMVNSQVKQIVEPKDVWSDALRLKKGE